MRCCAAASGDSVHRSQCCPGGSPDKEEILTVWPAAVAEASGKHEYIASADGDFRSPLPAECEPALAGDHGKHFMRSGVIVVVRQNDIAPLGGPAVSSQQHLGRGSDVIARR
jgi:hypothetical protein